MSFIWSSTFTVGPPTATSKGDKIILPQSALESIIKAHAEAPPPPLPQFDPTYDPTSWENHPSQNYNPYESRKPQELPSPLTFQIRNPANRLLTHGGVKEFSAEDGQVRLPDWMMSSLLLSPGDQVMVKYAALPKGTWAKFRPLSADYMEILDFRALLEAVLRSNYTTLTRGEVLKVHQGTKEFGFVVEELKPEPGEAVCITDTDLEVDIEPLDADMHDASTTGGHATYSNGGSKAGKGMANKQTLRIGSEAQGQVTVEDYQRWTVDVPNRKSGIRITVEAQEPGDLDVLVSTRAPVGLQDHIWADFGTLGARTITIPASDQDYATQQDSQTIHIGVYGRAPSTTSGSSSSSGEVLYSILVQYHDEDTSSGMASASSVSESASVGGEVPNKGAAGYQECSNCGSWIPERTMMLHSNFCLRNNVKCDRCGEVMKKEEFQNHFHCDHCSKNCVRVQSTNALGLCQLCFGPFWIPTEDPKHQKLVQRLARKYHSQLMTGCGNKWCRNPYCATFRGQEMDATTAATEMMKILKEAKGTTRKKVMAELLKEDVKGKYSIEWCVKALEAEKTDLDAAVQWLNLHAPRLAQQP
ncbi:ubiquitin fusion degradation protein UFD1-domain-containing protein [Gamsiella multidivaricata]|uniref:ubiquitin fusion degradation protein UFD1-domain-containing protein n=1 Tax=Gamsiella multidivaricata TaxID=101098 RepID=UPI00221EC4CE|nr:ubiquitin fusion degradation protein UFD1-domain-containing protein [Gamsiella multidivaricata]KAI7831776.1 ubiquitin fusion degradation protein UFD1-domain-containing protein [Gamsiella multidivaricata]